MSDVTVISTPIYQGEGKWFKFTLTKDGDPLDLTSASFGFHIKANVDDLEPLFSAAVWDRTQVNLGIIRTNLPASQTRMIPVGTYFGQLLTMLNSDTDEDKSQLVRFKIKKALITTVLTTTTTTTTTSTTTTITM